MKKILFALIFAAFIFGCKSEENNNNDNTPPVNNDTAVVEEKIIRKPLNLKKWRNLYQYLWLQFL